MTLWSVALATQLSGSEFLCRHLDNSLNPIGHVSTFNGMLLHAGTAPGTPVQCSVWGSDPSHGVPGS